MHTSGRASIEPVEGSRSAGLTAVTWLPVALGLVYLLIFLARLPSLIERVYWDSDAATAAVVAETANGAPVILERYGWFTSLWFALATRSTPFHRQIWEIAPCVFAAVSVALLAWVSWRLAGRWAAAMTATIAVASSPVVSYDRVTLNYHTATWVAVVIVSVYVYWLSERRSARVALPTAVAVALVAGTSLASDGLFFVLGFVPFVFAGILCVSALGLRRQGVTILMCALGALPVWWLTDRVMTNARFEVSPTVPLRLAPAGDLLPNLGAYLGQLAQVANGSVYSGNLRGELSFACLALFLAALVVPFVAARRAALGDKTGLAVYASFWAACVAASCLSFVVSSDSGHFGYYFTPVWYAAAAIAPVVLASRPSRRLAGGIAISVVVVGSIVGLDSKLEKFNGLPAVAAVTGRITAIADREHAPYGYADYWDSAVLTWNTSSAVRVQPVAPCIPRSDVLCPFGTNINTAWYRHGPTRSFVLEDRGSVYMKRRPPRNLGTPEATYPLGLGLTMYVYPYDVAQRLDYATSPWRS